MSISEIECSGLDVAAKDRLIGTVALHRDRYGRRATACDSDSRVLSYRI